MGQSLNRKWSKLIVVTEPSEKIVAERDRVLSEKVMRKTVPVLDPDTGDVTVQTTETVERIIEREVETCRETLMTLSLTDAENANINPVHMKTNVTAENSIETCMKGGDTVPANCEKNISVEKLDDSRGSVKVQGSIDCDEDSTKNSADDRPLGDGSSMSTDDSDHEVCTPLPQIPTSPDENANSNG